MLDAVLFVHFDEVATDCPRRTLTLVGSHIGFATKQLMYVIPHLIEMEI